MEWTNLLPNLSIVCSPFSHLMISDVAENWESGKVREELRTHNVFVHEKDHKANSTELLRIAPFLNIC